ncbi:MAG: hypothetical protein KIT09_08905 [Bryobacteraceae bacterium]|nr:hypothetical protein [Bryobacteraceae bacterium]
MRRISIPACTFILIALILSGSAILTAAVIHVPAGGNLQTAIDQAQLGDTITLQPGAVYSGSFRLRKKTGNAFLTITTATPNSMPPAETRMTPSAAQSLAKIVSPSNAPAIATDNGAHHYRLVGLELYAKAGIYSLGVVQIGSATATLVSDLASDIELDRLYIHGDPTAGGKVGVILNSSSTVVKNCWISDFKHTGQDTQAISGHNGPGPFTITNNYLEASTENVMFGAATPRISGMVPSDIVIRKNHFYKPPEWKTKGWWVKNLLEFKSARRVLVEGNVLENNWVGADQASFAIVLTVRTQAGAVPWAVVEDITIQRNIIRNSGSGVNILGHDTSANNLGIARRILFKDNLFYNIDPGKWGGTGRLFQILAGPEDVTIDHNTMLMAAGSQNVVMFSADPAVRFRMTNNLADHGVYGVSGTGKGTGTATLAYYAPGYVFQKNALIGGDSSKYPANNFFPATRAAVRFVSEANDNYALDASSPYKNAGTDSKDVGADIALVATETQGVTDQGSKVAQPPANVSVSPSSGSGVTQVFQFVYSDSKGFDNIANAYMLVNGAASYPNGCFVQYMASQNSLYLRNDASTAWMGPVAVGSGGGLNNNQCTVNTGSSSVSGSGNNLIVNVSLTFATKFTGQKTIYMFASNKDGLSGTLEAKGTWTPFQQQPPAAVSVTPSAGAGLNQTFQLAYSDPDGFNDIAQAFVLFNTSTAQANACYVRYVRSGNQLYLRDNAGTNWLGPITPGQSATLANAKCTLNANGSSAAGNSQTLGLNVAISFKTAFAGAKNIYMNVIDNANLTSNWQKRGTYTVRNSVPAPVSVTASASQGKSQAFQFIYSDADGYQNIQSAWVLFNATTNLATGCYVQYRRDQNKLWLRNDAGTAWLGPVTPGATATLQNTRCSIAAASISSSGSGVNMALNVTIAFKPAFAGTKNIYMKAQDVNGAASGLVAKGKYTVVK